MKSRLAASGLIVILFLLTGCQKAPPSTPITSGTEVESGFQDESPEELQAKIAVGDRDAAFRLGAMYHDGQGVGRDFTQALEYFEIAARGGEHRSMYNLGMMHLRGEGVDQDDVVARRWFTQAADAGNVRAPYQLGQLYYQGRGTSQDFGKAKENFEMSARSGMPEAQYNLAILFIRGEGTAQDLAEGYAWLLVARTYGYTKAEESIEKLEPQLTAEQKSQGKKRAEALSNEVETAKAVKAAGG